MAEYKILLDVGQARYQLRQYDANLGVKRTTRVKENINISQWG